MTDRFVTVPDSLELPAAVKVGVGRLHDSTVAGRALLTGADAAAQRSSLGLGTAAVADAADFATAAQGAKADASDVDQITLTGDLVLTLPVGRPAGQVYRCAITQDGVGGHTVTYDDQPVTVDATAGASTMVELHPVGAGYVVQYATAAGRRLATSATASEQRRVLGLTGMPHLDLSGLRATHAATPLTTPTYDASGQAVHPDVLVLDEPWSGYRYWMAMTPYTNGSEAVENASILASHDGNEWVVPAGLTNPIDTNAPSFLADPCLILDTGTLYCVYAGTKAKTSLDGVTWSARQEVTFAEGSGALLMSPSIVRDAKGVCHYWAVDGAPSPNVLMHASGTDPLTFGALAACTIVGGPVSRDLWHVAVREIMGGFVGAFTYANLDASGSGSTIHLATSHDGLTWQVGAEPALARDASIDWVSSMVYRGCLVPTSGLGGIWGRLWYSARSLSGEWRIGYTALTQHQVTTGATCTAVGWGAQESATGLGNTALGAGANAAVKGGIGNTGIGYHAALRATGAGNVAVGQEALSAPAGTAVNATTTASRQTAIGTESGQASAAVSNNITVIGYRATASGHAAIAIGSEARALHGHSTALGLQVETSAYYQLAIGAKHIEMLEQTAPGSAVANGARLYVKDNGAGKTQLCVIFATGAEIVLATEA